MDLNLIDNNNFIVNSDFFVNCNNLIPNKINNNNVFLCFQVLNESNNQVKLNISSNNVELYYNEDLVLEPNIQYTYRLQLLDQNTNKLALFQDNPIKLTNLNFL
jgi:hypothetical protein